MFEQLKNIKISEEFTNYPSFLVDSDILIEISKAGQSIQIEKKLLATNAILIFPTVSVMEVGFGPYDIVDRGELNFFMNMQKNVFVNQFDMFALQFAIDIKTGKGDKFKGKWVNVSPDSSNWYSAKESLMFYMRDTLAKANNARKLQVDVLMGAMAWNTRSFIWTNNIRDHLLASLYRGKTICNRTNKSFDNDQVACLSSFFNPIFNNDLLDRLLTGDQLNIFAELKRFTNHTEIIRILDYLENQ